MPSPFSFDRDLDEIWPVGGDGPCQRRRNLIGSLDPNGLDAHAGREMDEVEQGPGQVHLLVGMLRSRFKVLPPDIDIVLEGLPTHKRAAPLLSNLNPIEGEVVNDRVAPTSVPNQPIDANT